MFAKCTEVCFASFLSGGFITAIVVNPPERHLAKRISVKCFDIYDNSYDSADFKSFVQQHEKFIGFLGQPVILVTLVSKSRL